MQKISLASMKSGQKGRVAEISGGAALQRRLMSMDIYPGREISKASHFALKGPVTIRVGRTTIALGHTMAEKISVEIK
jgi:Fe2+ transport system protein FeoA